jgi:hypothetical protein
MPAGATDTATVSRTIESGKTAVRRAGLSAAVYVSGGAPCRCISLLDWCRVRRPVNFAVTR